MQSSQCCLSIVGKVPGNLVGTIAWLLCLFIALSGCGNNSSVATGASAKSGPRISLSSQRLLCPDRNDNGTGSTDELSNYLVLKTDRVRYDSGELQQMKDYVQRTLDPSYPPPDTLSWISAIKTRDPEACLLTTMLSNTGDSPMTVNGVVARNVQTPVPDTKSYHLLELCSLGATNPSKCFPQPCTQCGNAGGPACTVHVVLNSHNTSFSDARSDCLNGVTFNPGEQLEIDIYFQSSENYRYTVATAFSIQTEKGPLNYTIHQPITMSFATPKQFTCYKLQNELFEPIPETTKNTWCL